MHDCTAEYTFMHTDISTQQTLCVLPLACCAVKQVSSFNTASSSLLVTVHHGHSLCITAGRWHPKAAIWRMGGDVDSFSEDAVNNVLKVSCNWRAQNIPMVSWLLLLSLSITPDWDVREVEEIKLIIVEHTICTLTSVDVYIKFLNRFTSETISFISTDSWDWNNVT